MAGAVLLATACHHAKPADPSAPSPASQRLAAIAGQPLMVAPVQSFRSTSLALNADWTAAAKQALDSALSDTLRARVNNGEWVYPAALLTSFKQNPTYATDPRALSVQPLRGAKLNVGDRLPEPLASQLRTMIALHEGRLVLLPIELRLEPAPGGLSRTVLKLVLVDPRASIVNWSGEVAGVESGTFSGAFAGPLASRVADLFVGK
jgi:hypothetical protein